MNVAVAVLVVLIVAEAGYFLYSRYAGPINFPWKNMSTTDTLTQVPASPSIEEQYNKANGLANYAGTVPVRQISQEKLSAVLKYSTGIPPQMLAGSFINTNFGGVVLESGPDVSDADGIHYVWTLSLVGTTADKVKAKFTQDEVNAMTVNLFKADDSVVAIPLKDIAVGDNVVVFVTTDLLDWRQGQDKILIEVHRK